MAHALQHVTFTNNGVDLAADLRLPPGFDPDQRYAALVLGTPGSSVKEQIGANYAGRMADLGPRRRGRHRHPRHLRGGGYTVGAAMIDHRIKAIGTVVPVNSGRAMRQADVSSGDAVVRSPSSTSRSRLR